MTTSKILERVSECIRSSNRPLLVCHIAPDGDAIGSMASLGQAIRQMGREPAMACADPVPLQFDFVPGAESIVQEVSAPFDLVISLDCSSLDRLGGFPQMPSFAGTPLVNIDHHVTNTHFGDVNLVDAQAASTAGIVLRLLEYMACPLDAQLATSLLTGIVADTRGFRTSNVTAEVLDEALRLVKAGASLPDLARRVLDRRPVSAIRLWGAALASMRVENRVIWTCIPRTVSHAANHADGGDAGLVNFLVGANDVDAAAVFVEQDGEKIDVGLRAAPGFDVAQVALQLGGGGHALAAGCTMSGPLEQARQQLLALLQADLARQRHDHA